MKCNSNEVVVRSLIALGCGCECASENELLLAQKYGCPPSRMIFMNPVKPAHHVNTARVLNVPVLAFDNLSELETIRTHHANAQLLLRIETEGSYAGVESLSTKFGAAMDDVPTLLERCIELGLEMVGVRYGTPLCYGQSALFATVVCCCYGGSIDS